MFWKDFSGGYVEDGLEKGKARGSYISKERLQESWQEKLVAGVVGECLCHDYVQKLWSQPLGFKAFLDPSPAV